MLWGDVLSAQRALGDVLSCSGGEGGSPSINLMCPLPLINSTSFAVRRSLCELRKFLFHFTFIFIHAYLAEVGGSQ